MSQRKIGRACAAGLLAAALLLAGSAPADAAGKSPVSLWGWMMEKWQEWTGTVFGSWRSVETPRSGEGSWIKEGPGIDPNGGTVPRSGNTGTACQDCGDPATGPGGGL